ncbi:MAG: hypothetical protein Q8N63_02875 [Nanoarchaeota archaeon]|nr:hypothetical protein [Nanoarchaeota archaeon]
MKKLIFSLGILISLALIFSLNLVSAELCRGNDGYYHDCDNDRYFDRPNYETSYYYHGDYYPTRDYYYRGYYQQSCCGSRCRKDDGLTYKDAEEYKRTIEYNYEDRGISENIKYTINEKTDTNLHYDIPYLMSMNYYANQNANSEDKSRAWYSWMYE